MARYNKAGLAQDEKNGDPVQKSMSSNDVKKRDEWWKLSARHQQQWFKKLRKEQGTRFIATEKGFPTPDNLLAPLGLVYAIVIRDPVARFVSYYFWRWRDKSFFANLRALATSYISSTFRPAVARLQSNAPAFADFVDSEMPLDGYYIRRLLGIEDPTFSVDIHHLNQAKATLENVFSLILITENLAEFGPLLSSSLGWQHTSFSKFYQKANPPPDIDRLIAWRLDWRDEIRRLMPLDSRFYSFAKDLATIRLQTTTALNS
eukprot:CAMPEP_0197318064 /NCGR_PEP_ID=MMETSP0891-20130614/49389_1 /TAXON_ID=44058 ORGANISM="Aureoumbra lagunensis, Strain CCMP1510" /NCGR_SAMPLE_ID=MMETSP0891 /ASSEMBLY_ACC=CAM_ASM_000534 /LENGTH=260 /DNA_ID=CAMNT_0042808323 /DNA_START=235 /DNA_END=1014 /DNA_ORIENTATION=-